jgi:hypothetical protein
MGAALLSATAGALLDLPVEGRYALAFMVLTGITALLLRQELALAATSPPIEHGERGLVGIDEGLRVTRLRLGLENLQARSGGIETEPSVLWLPTDERTRRVWLRAHGADLVVGARTNVPGPRVARVSFAEHGPVYVLVRLGEDSREASGFATVPNLAADLVDQNVEIHWLDVRELLEEDAEAIGVSVAWANHVRIAVTSRT